LNERQRKLFERYCDESMIQEDDDAKIAMLQDRLYACIEAMSDEQVDARDMEDEFLSTLTPDPENEDV